MAIVRHQSGLTKAQSDAQFLLAKIVYANVTTNTNDYSVCLDYTTSLYDGLTVNFYAARDNFAPIGANNGYYGGGDTGANYTSNLQKLSFATETVGLLTSSNLSQPLINAASSKSIINGYISGGELNAANADIDTTHRLSFHNDTVAVVTSAALSQARTLLFGLSSISAGYFCGGDSTASGSEVVTADKLAISTEITAAQTSANLGTARARGVSGGNTVSHGYMSGGFTGASVNVTTTEKLRYSTDVTAAQVSADLTTATRELGGADGPSASYFAGGITTGARVVVAYKITYSTDVLATQVSANLSQARNLLGGTFSTTNGYFSGGNTPTAPVTTTDKLVFSTEITAAQSSSNLAVANDSISSTSSSNIYPATLDVMPEFVYPGTKGYFAGGSSGAIVSTTDKLVFSTDTTAAQVSANLSQARTSLAGLSSKTEAYFCGGDTGADVATADKLVFATDVTTATITANLSVARRLLASASEVSTKGYFAGGASASNSLIADKITFFTGITVAQSSANLSQARYSLAGTSDISTKGYFAGGDSGAFLVTADKLVFSTDTTAAQSSANLSQARLGVSGTNAGSASGYFAGGYTNNPVTTADKLVFSTDTTAAQSSANLSVARYLTGTNASTSAGYFAGGSTTGGRVATADKLVFSTDTTAAQVSANLSTVRSILAGSSEIYLPINLPATPILKYGNNEIARIDLSVGDIQSEQLAHVTYNSGSKGYFAGGYTSAVVTTTDKLVFSTDTTAAQASANSSQARHSLTGVVATTKGYFAGGETSAAVATADKSVFSTDITTAQSSANLSQARYGAASANSSPNGYFAGGSTASSAYVTTADKLAFSTDITTAQSSANLSQARYGAASANSSANGYFAGGSTGAFVTTADKLVFSTDVTAAQASANLSQARFTPAGTNSSTNGYFAGGTTAAAVTTADKLVFSTDVTAAQASANLSQARYGLAGTNSSANGYFAGGNNGGGAVATANKLVFSTDVTAAQASANLSQARFYLAGSSEPAAFILDCQNYDLSYVGGEAIQAGNIVYLSQGIAYKTQSVNSRSTRTSFLGAAASPGLTSEPFNVRIEGGLPLYSFNELGPQYIGWNISGGAIDPNSPADRGISVGASIDLTTLSISIESRSPVNKAYFAGGASGAEVELATTDRILFSTKTTVAQTSASLSQARQSMASISEGITKGYLAGGETGAAIPVTTGNILTYSTDTGVAGAALPAARAGIAGLSEGGSKGYAAGGYSGADLETLTGYVVTFATDTFAAVVSSDLSQARQNHGSVSEGSTKGYYVGGHTGADLEVATGDRITFATDTTAALASSNLTIAKANFASISDGYTKGYFMGGESGTIVVMANTDKITYSTDTTAAQASANLSQARRNATGVSDGVISGYASGGETVASTSVTTGDRIVFATDTTAAQTSAALTTAKHQCGGISEASL